MEYNSLLNHHALKSLVKIPDVPDHKLMIGNAENLFPQENLQLGATASVNDALINPEIMSVEDLGTVGDGIGVVSQDDFGTTSFWLGYPVESEV